MVATACTIYEDMQLAAIAEAHVNGSELNLKWFFDIESKFDCSKHWGGAGSWEAAKRTNVMQPQTIFWPDDLGASDT